MKEEKKRHRKAFLLVLVALRAKGLEEEKDTNARSLSSLPARCNTGGERVGLLGPRRRPCAANEGLQRALEERIT